MTLDKDRYVARIANAGGVRLTVITYEIAADWLGLALSALDACLNGGGEAAEAEFRYAAERARSAVECLMDSLDMSYDIAKGLFPIYIYVNRRLAEALAAAEARPGDAARCVNEARDIVATLLDGWRQAEKTQEETGPLMEHSQQIYAGLTYKNASLEEYVEDDGNRGFKA